MHHWQYTEIAPIAPALPAAGEGVAALFPLLLWIIALSLLVIWRHTVGALLEHLAHLLNRVSIPTPWGSKHLLGFVASGLQDADYAVQQALSVSANACERAAVYLFHKSLTTFQAVGRELYRLAEATGYALMHTILHTIPHLIRVGIHKIEHQVAQNLHVLRVLEHALVRPLMVRVHRFEAWVEGQFGLAHRGIDVTKRDLARAEKSISRLSGRVKAIEGTLAAATFAGVVALAIDRWLGKWWRCPSLRNIGRHTGCKGFKFLEDLLLGVIDVLLVADLCRITKALISTAESQIVQDALSGFIDGIEHLMLCQGTSRPKVWHVHAAALPPQQKWSVLPPVG